MTIPENTLPSQTHPFSKRLYLRRFIPRPKWLIKHESVAYDKEKDLLGSGNFCSVYKGSCFLDVSLKSFESSGQYTMAGGETRTVAVKISHISTSADLIDPEEAKV